VLFKVKTAIFHISPSQTVCELLCWYVTAIFRIIRYKSEQQAG